MEFLSIYLTLGLVILGLMTLLWLLSLALKNASIVDIFWGTGFVITAWVGFFLTPDGFLARKLLLCALVTIWGLRLSIHILIRNGGKPEDFRYQAWRKENGESWWWRSFFKVFLLQGVLMWLISAPLLAAQMSPNPAKLIWLDFLAVLVWVYGFFFEAVLIFLFNGPDGADNEVNEDARQEQDGGDNHGQDAQQGIAGAGTDVSYDPEDEA